MPVYNVETAIPIILSLMPQLDQNSRIFVLQNGPNSKDSSIKQIKYFGQNIEIFRTSRKLGTIRSYNILLCFCHFFRPEFFSFISDHDELSPNWLETLQSDIKSNSKLLGIWAQTKIKNKSPTKTNGRATKYETSPQKNFKALLTLKGNPKYKVKDLNAKLINTYLMKNELFNNYGYLTYGLFRFHKIRKLGLIPEVLFGDRWFVLKLLSLGAQIKLSKKCHRLDKQTNKDKHPTQLIEEQRNKICGDTVEGFINFKSNALSVWDAKHHGRYLKTSPTNIDLELLGSVHRLFMIRKFQNFYSTETPEFLAENRFAISIEEF